MKCSEIIGHEDSIWNPASISPSVPEDVATLFWVAVANEDVTSGELKVEQAFYLNNPSYQGWFSSFYEKDSEGKPAFYPLYEPALYWCECNKPKCHYPHSENHAQKENKE